MSSQKLFTLALLAALTTVLSVNFTPSRAFASSDDSTVASDDISEAGLEDQVEEQTAEEVQSDEKAMTQENRRMNDQLRQVQHDVNQKKTSNERLSQDVSRKAHQIQQRQTVLEKNQVDLTRLQKQADVKGNQLKNLNDQNAKLVDKHQQVITKINDTNRRIVQLARDQRLARTKQARLVARLKAERQRLKGRRLALRKLSRHS